MRGMMNETFSLWHKTIGHGPRLSTSPQEEHDYIAKAFVFCKQALCKFICKESTPVQSNQFRRQQLARTKKRGKLSLRTYTRNDKILGFPVDGRLSSATRCTHIVLTIIQKLTTHYEFTQCPLIGARDCESVL